MSQGPIATLPSALKGSGPAVASPLLADANGALKVSLPAGAQSVKQAGQKYATVAASQTAQALGTGAVGDVLASVLIVPATTSPGVVQIKDGSGTAITVFTGGATSVADLKPINVPLNAVSATGGWQITTGANVSAIAVGTFTA